MWVPGVASEDMQEPGTAPAWHPAGISQKNGRLLVRCGFEELVGELWVDKFNDIGRSDLGIAIDVGAFCLGIV